MSSFIARSILATCMVLLAATVVTHARVVEQLTNYSAEFVGAAVLDDSGRFAYVAATHGAIDGPVNGLPFERQQVVRWDLLNGDIAVLTEFNCEVTSPSVSDDGRYIAFICSEQVVFGQNRDRSAEAFLFDSEQGSVSQLTDDALPNGGSVKSVRIAGSGNRVIFISNSDPLGTNPDGADQLFVLNSDGTQLRQLTNGSSPPAGATISDDGQKIAFAWRENPFDSNPDWGWEIFAIDADGQNLRQITNSVRASDSPFISGDGSVIVFDSNGDLTGSNPLVHTELFAIDWNGQNLRQITTTDHPVAPFSGQPSVSDDGQHIVFLSNQTDGGLNEDALWHVRLDGSDKRRLSIRTSGDRQVLDGTISGNGSMVSFRDFEPGAEQIGDDVRLLVRPTNAETQVSLGSMSPTGLGDAEMTADGNRVYFLSDETPDDNAIFWIDTHTRSRTLVSQGMRHRDPAVSEDGGVIVFASDGDPLGSNTDGSTELFAYDQHGAVLRQLTSVSDPTGLCESPEVSLDGSTIVFESTADLTGQNPDRSREIFRVGLDASGLLQLTDGAGGTKSEAPRISGNGAFVSFVSNADLLGRGGGPSDVYRVATDASGLKLVSATVPGVCRGSDLGEDGDLITYVCTEDVWGTNPDNGTEIFTYRVSTGIRQQLTDLQSGSVLLFGDGRTMVRMAADESVIVFGSDAPIFEEDPDDPIYVYEIDVATGTVGRLSALRPVVGIDSITLDRTGSRFAFLGLGNHTEQNPSGLQRQIWQVDTRKPWRTDVVPGTELILQWNYAAGPIRYDSIRGDLSQIHRGANGETVLGTVECLEDDFPSVFVEDHSNLEQDDPDPWPGTAFFYLVRGSLGLEAGPGSYGSGTSGGERTASAGDCAP